MVLNTFITTAQNLSPSQTTLIQSIPSHPASINIHFNIPQPPDLQRGLFPPGFPTKILYVFKSPHMCQMPNFSYPPWFVHLNNIKSWTASLRNALHSPDTSYHLGPSILLSALLVNTLMLQYSLTVRERVSHPHKSNHKLLSYEPHNAVFIYLNTHSVTGTDNATVYPHMKWKLWECEWEKEGQNISLDG